jgi:hypothetical protein
MNEGVETRDASSMLFAPAKNPSPSDDVFFFQLLAATVNEDGFELSLTVSFALRGGDSTAADDASYGGLPTGTYRDPGSFRSGRRSSLTRYASQDSLGEKQAVVDNIRPRSSCGYHLRCSAIRSRIPQTLASLVVAVRAGRAEI